MRRLLKFVGLAIVFYLAAVAAFYVWAVHTESGRRHVVCRLYDREQLGYVQGDEMRARMARVLPRSGEAGALDAPDGPATPARWLPLAEGLWLPVPDRAWTIRPPAMTVVIESGDDVVTIRRDELSDLDEVYAHAGEAIVGKAWSRGEMVNAAYSNDMTRPCDPRRPPLELAVDLLLFSVKGAPGPSGFLGGVRDQAPGATTLLYRRVDGDVVTYRIEMLMKAPAGRWIRIEYALHDEQVALGIIRHLRDASRVHEGAPALIDSDLSQWRDALVELEKL